MLDKTKYPIEITDDRDMLYDMSEREYALVDKCFSMIYRPSMRDIRFIKKASKENNHIPELYNALAIAHGNRREYSKAVEINREAYRRFPNYLYAKLNIVHLLIKEEKLDEAVEIMGGYQNMHINTVYPDRNVFHSSEVISFYSAAGRCQALSGDHEEAENTLNDLLEICEDDNPSLDPLVGALIEVRSELRQMEIDEERKWVRQVSSFPTTNFQPTHLRPDLHHKELVDFYAFGINELSESQIKELINLPRETLVDDLVLIVRDGIQRYQFTLNYEEWEPWTHSFMFHAINFLGALKAEEALEEFLNMLRQGEGFHDYWFGEGLELKCLPALYDMGQNSLLQLSDFVKERNISTYAKSIVSRSVSQIALHDIGRREEVISWFKDMIDYYKVHQSDGALFDTTFLSFMASDIVDMRATECIEEIEWMFDQHWVMPTIIGKKNNIIEEIKLPINPATCNPKPRNIYEYYNLEYRDRRLESNENDFNTLFNSKSSRLIEKKIVGLFDGSEVSPRASAWDLPEDDQLLQYHDDEENPATYVRTETKVGRNDPCPCGSNKKYKKCCLRAIAK